MLHISTSSSSRKDSSLARNFSNRATPKRSLGIITMMDLNPMKLMTMILTTLLSEALMASE